MKVEQRIGRIERIGQRHREIPVLNLRYVGSPEHIVYGHLLIRLHIADIIVGTQQISRLPVTPKEFAQFADKTFSAEELERQATKRAQEAHQRTNRREMPPELYQIYRRLADQANLTRIRVDLQAIWEMLQASIYLQNLGCRLHEEGNELFMIVSNIPGVVDGAAITASRTTFDVGIPTFEGRLHFVTYGDPVSEAIVQQVEVFPLPDCIRRLEVETPDVPATIVGYAVAERDTEDQPYCRLVTSRDGMATVYLDAAVRLSQDDVEQLRQRRNLLRDHRARVSASGQKSSSSSWSTDHRQLSGNVARGKPVSS